uniref:Coiled-coil domain containing 127 n=1 Tax=Rousettus aegyptiacus TaxID=9407 RepID=A0A7J8EXD3_ROUAE|nr:coiled-coil domain containing 127 [Rousettus aegyptiacus]
MELCPVGSHAGIGCFPLDLVSGVPERNRERERSLPPENSGFPAGSRSQVPRHDLRRAARRGSVVLGTGKGAK